MSQTTLLTAASTLLLAASSAAPALAAGESFVLNFEEFATGPSLFADAGDAIDLVIPGRITASGGVLIGFGTNFPASNFPTIPNVLATTNIPDPSFGGGLLPTLTIEVDESFEVFQLEGLLFNGANTPSSFTTTAFAGTEVIQELSFDNLAGNLDEGNTVFAFDSETPITRVEISAIDTSAFNFLIDTIAFNQSIAEAFEESVNPSSPTPPLVPTPAALPLGLLMLGGLIGRRRC